MVEVPVFPELPDSPDELGGQEGQVVGQEVVPAGRKDRERREDGVCQAPERCESEGPVCRLDGESCLRKPAQVPRRLRVRGRQASGNLCEAGGLRVQDRKDPQTVRARELEQEIRRRFDGDPPRLDLAVNS